MELNHLRAFYEVAKVGRFSEAAKRLNISQSALSRAVALLEESEKVQLFERSKKGVTLTTMGSEVFRYCESLFQTVNKIEEVCRGVRENCEGLLHFATTDHVTNDLLISPLRSFREEYPLVVPSIYTGTPDEIITTLVNTECEFGLLFSKLSVPQIEYQALRREPMALVVHPELWRENKSLNQAATINKILSKQGYIASIGAHAQGRPSRVLKEIFGKMPQVGFEANGQESQKRVCLARGGIAYLARFMVDREIKSGQLHEIEVGEPHSFYLWLARKKGVSMSLPARTFLQRLQTSWGPIQDL